MTTQPMMLVFIPYAVIAIGLTISLARTLARHGGVFLRSIFPDRTALADAINQLLVIGFYLVNLGWALLLLCADQTRVASIADASARLIDRVGILLLLLGAAHLANLYVFHWIRRGAEHAASTPRY